MQQNPTPMKLKSLADGRILLDSGSAWEPLMGYSRAVVAGDTIHVAGCVGVEADGSYSSSLSRQTARCMERIEEALRALGAGVGEIVRARIYTTRIEDWRDIASVLGPIFAATRPANSLLGVAALVDPAALVEIEVDAWTGSAARRGSALPGASDATASS